MDGIYTEIWGPFIKSMVQTVVSFGWIKRHYSAFSGTDLDIRLRERRISTVILTGVLTDICVLHTAIDAYNLGYDIEIVKPAVASIWPENHQFALGHFKNTLGAKLVDENLNEISE